jgi:hypothetical protein
MMNDGEILPTRPAVHTVKTAKRRKGWKEVYIKGWG